MIKIHKGIEKITLGILPSKPIDPVINTEQDDDLIRVANRIIENLALVSAPVDSVVRFILLAASTEGLELEFNAHQKKFRRVKKDKSHHNKPHHN